MKLRALASALKDYFLGLSVIGGLPTLEVDGNLVPASALVPYLGLLNLYGSNINPQINYSAVTNASTTALAWWCRARLTTSRG